MVLAVGVDHQLLSTGKGLLRESGGVPTPSSYVVNITSRICIRVYLVEKDSELHSHLPEYRKTWQKNSNLNNLN